MAHSMDLLIPQLDSLSRYDFAECENGYQFVTDSRNTYIVSFVEYPIIEDAYYTELYAFNIERVDDANHDNGKEEKVRNTIVYILYLFFQKHNRALITVCDTFDGRQECRQRLFERWYKLFANGMIDHVVEKFKVNETTETYANMFYRKTDIDAKPLEIGFHLLATYNFFN